MYIYLIRHDKLRRRHVLEMEGYQSEAALLKRRLTQVERSLAQSQRMRSKSIHSPSHTHSYLDEYMHSHINKENNSPIKKFNSKDDILSMMRAKSSCMKDAKHLLNSLESMMLTDK